MAVLRVDFPHNGNPPHVPGRRLNPAEGGRDLPAALQNAAPGKARPPAQILPQRLHPAPPKRLRAAGADLIGPHLVPGNRQRVSPHRRRQRPADHRQGDGKARVPVNIPDVQGQQRHLRVSRLVQRLPHQPDAAGAPALVSGLSHQHAALRRVILPGFQGGQHLPRHQKDGVAQFIVEIPHPPVRQAPLLPQQDRLPLPGSERVPQQGEPIVQKSGNQQRAGHSSLLLSGVWALCTVYSLPPFPVQPGKPLVTFSKPGKIIRLFLVYSVKTCYNDLY